jgi:hypothetical protein
MIIGISHPSSNNSALAWNRTCANQNDLNASFEDGAAAVLCRQPTVGNFTPSSTFSVFESVPANGDWTLTITDNAVQDSGVLNSWYLEVCVNIITPLSSDSFQIDGLSIYPNPNNGNFNIVFDNAVSDKVAINVFDISGRSVYVEAFEVSSTFNQNINLNGVSPGLYLVQIVDGTRTTTQKVIVK